MKGKLHAPMQTVRSYLLLEIVPAELKCKLICPPLSQCSCSMWLLLLFPILID